MGYGGGEGCEGQWPIPFWQNSYSAAPSDLMWVASLNFCPDLPLILAFRESCSNVLPRAIEPLA